MVVERQVLLIVIAVAALLPVGCATNVGEWNWSVGPLITSEPYDESGKRKEPVDLNEWHRYYESTRTSDVPAKAESPGTR